MKNLLKKQSWRILVLVTLIVAIIYGVLFFVLGRIPNIRSIELFAKQSNFSNLVINLPFAISRFWDILFLFFYLFLLTKLLVVIKGWKNKNNRSQDLVVLGLAYSSIIGLIIAVISGIISQTAGIFSGLEVIVITGFSFGFITELVFSSDSGFLLNIENGLLSGLVLSIIINFWLGSIFGLGFGLVFFLMLITGSFLGLIFDSFIELINKFIRERL